MGWGYSSVGKVPAWYAQSPRFDSQHLIKLAMVICACDCNPLEVEAGGPEILGHLHGEFEAGLCCNWCWFQGSLTTNRLLFFLYIMVSCYTCIYIYIYN